MLKKKNSKYIINTKKNSKLVKKLKLVKQKKIIFNKKRFIKNLNKFRFLIKLERSLKILIDVTRKNYAKETGTRKISFSSFFFKKFKFFNNINKSYIRIFIKKSKLNLKYLIIKIIFLLFNLLENFYEHFVQYRKYLNNKEYLDIFFFFYRFIFFIKKNKFFNFTEKNIKNFKFFDNSIFYKLKFFFSYKIINRLFFFFNLTLKNNYKLNEYLNFKKKSYSLFVNKYDIKNYLNNTFFIGGINYLITEYVMISIRLFQNFFFCFRSFFFISNYFLYFFFFFKLKYIFFKINFFNFNLSFFNFNFFFLFKKFKSYLKIYNLLKYKLTVFVSQTYNLLNFHINKPSPEDYFPNYLNNSFFRRLYSFGVIKLDLEYFVGCYNVYHYEGERILFNYYTNHFTYDEIREKADVYFYVRLIMLYIYFILNYLFLFVKNYFKFINVFNFNTIFYLFFFFNKFFFKFFFFFNRLKNRTIFKFDYKQRKMSPYLVENSLGYHLYLDNKGFFKKHDRIEVDLTHSEILIRFNLIFLFKKIFQKYNFFDFKFFYFILKIKLHFFFFFNFLFLNFNKSFVFSQLIKSQFYRYFYVFYRLLFFINKKRLILHYFKKKLISLSFIILKKRHLLKYNLKYFNKKLYFFVKKKFFFYYKLYKFYLYKFNFLIFFFLLKMKKLKTLNFFYYYFFFKFFFINKKFESLIIYKYFKNVIHSFKILKLKEKYRKLKFFKVFIFKKLKFFDLKKIFYTLFRKSFKKSFVHFFTKNAQKTFLNFSKRFNFFLFKSKIFFLLKSKFLKFNFLKNWRFLRKKKKKIKRYLINFIEKNIFLKPKINAVLSFFTFKNYKKKINLYFLKKKKKYIKKQKKKFRYFFYYKLKKYFKSKFKLKTHKFNKKLKLKKNIFKKRYFKNKQKKLYIKLEFFKFLLFLFHKKISLKKNIFFLYFYFLKLKKFKKKYNKLKRLFFLQQKFLQNLKFFLVIKSTRNNLFTYIYSNYFINFFIYKSNGISGYKGPVRSSASAGEKTGYFLGTLARKLGLRRVIFLINKKLTKKIKECLKGFQRSKIKIKQIILLPKIPHNGVRYKKQRRT